MEHGHGAHGEYERRGRIARTNAFRKSVKVDDTSHCGIIIEVKLPEPQAARLAEAVGQPSQGRPHVQLGDAGTL
ncbi:hypothetical protein CYFUS_005352 [Cystobacter fuscus]|uniref:Uncharacterized protein n=1 Tax=Cystobacter fuscus TaxID=43 RepID=A0A250J7L2_9BACT|nr:hypothetical protein [Cystobacter fuscus]ATB39904.1 hypothetical protein CYFUS_005352 [Cystobacter fuscus]